MSIKKFFITISIVVMAKLSAIRANDHSPFILTGATAPLDFNSVLVRYRPPLSQENLKKLAIEITDLYKAHGYATSYVEKIIVRNDSKIEILIRESKIKLMVISGVNERSAKEIKKIITPDENELYNSKLLKERSDHAIKNLNLANLKISVYNDKDSSDVVLKVEASESKIGQTSFKVSWEPIYGLSPVFSNQQNFENFQLNIQGGICLKEKSLRKKYAAVSLKTISEKNINFFLAYGICSNNEVWYEKSRNYTVLSHDGDVGINYYIKKNFTISISASSSIFKLENYFDWLATLCDISVHVNCQYYTVPLYVMPYEGTDASLKFSLLKSELEKKYLFFINFYWQTSASLHPTLAVRPQIIGYYTTSDERYYFSYIYDQYLPLRADDLSATFGKTIGNLFVDYEVYPEILRFGPAIYGAIFTNEYTKSINIENGAGIHCSVAMNTVYMDAMYIIPLTMSWEKPIFLFSVRGVF